MSVYERLNTQMVRGLTARYALRPATTGVPAVGAVVTTGAGAWGAQKTIIAANAITTEFWLVSASFDTLGGVQIFEGQISDATPTVLSEFRFDPTAVTPNLGPFPLGPYPIAMPANALVQARAGGAAAKVIGVSLLVAVGL